MKGVYLIICFELLFVLFLGETCAAELKNDGVYIVYMGAARFSDGSPRSDHTQLLSSLIQRNKSAVIHTYSKGFSGFAARLSEDEAKQIAQKPGVVSVFPETVVELHTTRSWDFLSRLKSSSRTSGSSNPSSLLADSSVLSGGSDMIIGVIDTGITPESKSFNDADIGPIPSRWKGLCMQGKNFLSTNCNRKLVGARYYDPADSPIDDFGHGTHVSSTAAGIPVVGASYYGLANGTAQGGSPASRIAMYRVCGRFGCPDSAILKAMDDAIGDGVDVMSLSIGSVSNIPKFVKDPIAIGAFHAMERGIFVACSAGNSGPYNTTVVNTSPWILTVAATTIDRDFQANIMLGGEKTITGGGITFSNLKKTPDYPLIDAYSAKSDKDKDAEKLAKYCLPGLLDADKVKGKIVVCRNPERDYNDPYDTFLSLQELGAVGMILIDNRYRFLGSNYFKFPISSVTEEDGAEILSYIKSASKPQATILPTKVVLDYKPAPAVIFFSSRGPAEGIPNLIKPDIAAPGVAILAAWSSIDDSQTLPHRKRPDYAIISGTSMACPHVSGLAAAVKSQHPTWSPSAIKSAIMTTATQTNNLNSPIATNMGSKATPYDIGSGLISLSGPFQPGLVYETDKMDYISFLCNFGYDTSQVKMIALDLPKDFSCPDDSSPDYISNMNYPSIAVSNLKKNGVKTVYRTVTNVGEDESIYTAIIEAPAGVEVSMEPEKLVFTKDVKKLMFQVSFKATAAFNEHLFGSITWANDKYMVRSPFSVRSD